MTKSILLLLITVVLSACGGSTTHDNQSTSNTGNSDATSPPPPSGNDNPPVSTAGFVDFDFTPLANHQAYQRSQIQSRQLTNATGFFKLPIANQSLTGNITFSVEVADPDGINSVHVGFTGSDSAMTLCDENCGQSFSLTKTGVNPLDAGMTSGDQRLELWIMDNEGNKTVINTLDFDWHVTPVTGISADRNNNSIDLSWNRLGNYLRYNVYIAAEPGVTPDNFNTLDDGEAFYALTNPNMALAGKEDSRSFYTMVTAIDGSGESAFGEAVTVPAVVGAIDNPPKAKNDTFTMEEDSEFSASLTANDSDEESGEVDIFTAPLKNTKNGELAIFADGSFNYQPKTNFHGRDAFTYQVRDGIGQTDSATVIITVTDTNDAPSPSFNNYNVITDEGDNLSFKRVNGVLEVSAPGLLINDVDIDSAELSVVTTPVTAPTKGTLALNSDGSFIYTVNPGGSGEDSFTYQTTDGTVFSTPTLVRISIDGENFPPIAANDYYSLEQGETFNSDNSASERLPVLSNDTDLDEDDQLSVSAISQLPLHGDLTLDADGTVQYIPDPGFYGTDIAQYQIVDNDGNQAQAAILFTIIQKQNPPTADSDNYSLDEDSSFTVDSESGVLANDSDEDFDSLTINTELITQPNNGIVSMSADGSFSYTPDQDFFGTDTFSYQLNDSTGLSSVGSVQLQVANINDAPIANDDIANTTNNAQIIIDVLTNDTDIEGNDLTVTSATLTPNNAGSAIINTDGSLTYIPDGDFEGNAQINYAISDGHGETANAIVYVAVNIANTQPIANDDSYNVAEDSFIVANGVIHQTLINNDSDPDGDALSILTAPIIDVSHGELALNEDGSFSYQPDENFFGIDQFSYQLRDARGGSASANVTINVISVNDIPDANDDSATTAEETLINIDVLINDDDQDNDSLTITSATAEHGIVTIAANQTLDYTPGSNFVGTDQINYSISDGNSGTDTATVNVVVLNVNDNPIAVDDQAITAQNSRININVLANDSDIDGDALVVVQATAATGSVRILGNNRIRYTPETDFLGQDIIEYQIGDGNGGTDSAQVFVTVSIDGENQDPQANDDEVELNEDTVTIIDVLSNDTDPEGAALSITSASANHGEVTINNDDSLTYTPELNYNGNDIINYSITDGHGGNDSAKVRLDIISINDAPIAVNDTAVTAQDTPVTINVLANDSDVDSNQLSITSASAAFGAVTITPSRRIVYSPNNGFSGVDTINYEISDEHGATASATVTVSVGGVNNPPIAIADTATTNEDQAIVIDVLANDSDPDGDNIALVSATAEHGTVTIDASEQLIYQGNDNYHGVDTITYIISDSFNLTASTTVTITINPVNDAPIAVADHVQMDEDTIRVIKVLENDLDVDQDVLMITSVSPSHGEVAILADQTLSYTPLQDHYGPATIEYSISDPSGLTATSSVSIEITAINDPPVAAEDSATTDEDTLVNINAIENDTDVDSLNLTITLAEAEHGSVEIKEDFSLDYTPDPDFNGEDTITYTLDDGELSSTGTVIVAITPINDQPVAVDDEITIDEDNSVLIAVLDNDSDIDGDSLTITVDSTSIGGSTITEDQQILYQPIADYHGEVVIEYSISDGADGSASATVLVNITSINDLPVAVDDSATSEEDQSISVDVLANDYDNDDPELILSIVNVSHGSAEVIDNEISYTPAENFHGEATISYQIEDQSGASAQADLIVTVTSINDIPVAVNDLANTDEDTSIEIDALSNDTDADGDELTIVLATARNGQVIVHSDNQLQYNPIANYNGIDIIEYQLSDGHGGFGSATVTVTIAAINDQPSAQADQYQFDEDTSATLDVLSNDYDVDEGTELNIISASSDDGNVSVISGSSLEFTPNDNFNGQTTVEYTITDDECPTLDSCTSDHYATTTATLIINPINDQPSSEDATVTMAENVDLGHVIHTVVATDVDEDTLEYQLQSGNDDQIFDIDTQTGEISVVDKANLDAQVTNLYVLNILISDPLGSSTNAYITINITQISQTDTLVADDSFGNSEITGVSLSNAFAFDNIDQANASVRDSQGRVIIAGSVTNSDEDLAITRYLSDGSSDQSFGIQGMLTKDLGGFETITAVTVDDNDNIYLAGEQFNGDAVEILVIKLQSDGNLDSDFGAAGVTITAFGQNNLQVSDILYHSDGSLYVAAALNNEFALYQYESTDGSVLQSATFDIDGEYEIAQAIAEQADGKIIMAGHSADSSNEFNYDFAVARIDNNSFDLDTSFNASGMKVFDLGQLSDDLVRDVVIADNGAIALVGASAQATGIYDVALAQMDSSGILNDNIGTNGVMIIDADNDSNSQTNSSIANSATLDNGDLYLGIKVGLDGQNQDVGVIKIISGGDFDNSFGQSGIATIDLGSNIMPISANGGNNQLAKVMIDADSQPLLATSAPGSRNQDFALARLTTTGDLDDTFAQGGFNANNLSASDDTLTHGIALTHSDNAGKFIAIGQTQSDVSVTDGLIARYHSDGSLDSSFGDDGYIRISSNSPAAYQAKSVVELTDGRLAIAGTFGADSFVALLQSDGQPDNSFDDDGIKTLSGQNDNQQLSISAIGVNDDLLTVAGSAFDITTTSSDVYLARLTTSGSLDSSYGSSGEVYKDLSAIEMIHNMALQSDGSLIVVGEQFNSADDQSQALIAKFDPNGALDSSGFNGGYHIMDLDSQTDDNSDKFNAVIIDNDGNIYASGTSISSNTSYTAIASMTASGQANSSFNNTGLTLFDFDNTNTNSPSLSMDTEQRLLLTGSSENHAQGGHDIFITRINLDGLADPELNNGNPIYLDHNQSDAVSMIIALSDGNILIGGHNQLSNYNNQVWYLQMFKLVQQ